MVGNMLHFDGSRLLLLFFFNNFIYLWLCWAEKAMAPHSSTLAWKIPWTAEPGRLQSMGSLRVRHDWVASLSLSFSCIGEGNGNPLQCSCLENPRDRGAWWASVYGVAQSWTQLKRLSSSSMLGLHCCVGFFLQLWWVGAWSGFSLQWLLLLQSMGSIWANFSSCSTWAQ